MKIFRLSTATEWRPKAAHGKTVGFVVKTDQAPERGERNVRRSIFCRPIQGLDIFWTIQPTVLPWATFCRASGALITAILFFAVRATAQTTNDLSDAEVQGRKLALQLLAQRPTENFTNTGTLIIRNKEGKQSKIALRDEILVGAVFWTGIYEATTETNQISLGIVHLLNRGDPNRGDIRYALFKGPLTSVKTNMPLELYGNQTMIPFAGSDFWLADLGLEFFYWPEQKILKHEMRRGRACKVLESTNPSPSTNSYLRVVSWIDNESGGIVQAEAYNFKNKLLKEFAPKSFKKVNGQWELQEMEIRNVQTGSRTRLEFDLKKE